MKICDPMLRSHVFNDGTNVEDDIIIGSDDTYTLSVSPDSLLSPSSVMTEAIAVTGTDTEETVPVEEAIYLPADNLLILNLGAGGLKTLALRAELTDDVRLSDGSSGAQYISGTAVRTLPLNIFDAGVLSIEFLDSQGRVIAHPASGEAFTAKITVVNNTKENKTGTLSLFVQNSDNPPVITDTVTVNAGETKVFSFNSTGANLNENEILTADFIG